MKLEKINTLIAASRPRSRFGQSSLLVLLGLSALLGAFWASPGRGPASDVLSWLLPQVLVTALIAVVYLQWRRQRTMERLASEATEAVQLQDWLRAEELLCQVLGRPVRRATLRTQGLLALAAVADASHAHEGTETICRHILDSGTGNVVQRHTAEVALAGAMLKTGQITDAVDAVDRLTRKELPGPLRAQVELLALFREVTMGHPDMSVARAQERSDLFRTYLGTKAGYGYGLLAAAFDAIGQSGHARQCWHMATLLVPAERLVDRFHELGPIARRYPAAEHPV